MRHRKIGRKLGRNSSHRKAMYRNMITSLFKHEQLETTDAKAKELRPIAEKMIGLAKRGDLHSRRQALSYMKDKSVGAVFGQGHIVDCSGKSLLETRAPAVTTDSLFAWFAGGAEFMQPSCLFSRKAWFECGPLVEDLHYAMDLDLWVKISEKFKFKKIRNYYRSLCGMGEPKPMPFLNSRMLTWQ